MILFVSVVFYPVEESMPFTMGYTIYLAIFFKNTSFAILNIY